ncbi:hypothetical protein C0991_001260 [Blastosporella zonata]|nr:hypothetical protein C0991_001260 [Blastosporella zonata]
MDSNPTLDPVSIHTRSTREESATILELINAHHTLSGDLARLAEKHLIDLTDGLQALVLSIRPPTSLQTSSPHTEKISLPTFAQLTALVAVQRRYIEAADTTTKKLGSYSAAIANVMGNRQGQEAQKAALPPFTAHSPRPVGEDTPSPQPLDHTEPIIDDIPITTVTSPVSAPEIPIPDSVPVDSNSQLGTTSVANAAVQEDVTPRKQASLPKRPSPAPNMRPSQVFSSPSPSVDNSSSVFRSLREMFPYIDSRLLLLVARHEIDPLELWKLDIRESARRRNTELTSSMFEPSSSSAPISSIMDDMLRQFPTLNTLLVPLTMYFRIIEASLSLTLYASRTNILELQHIPSPALHNTFLRVMADTFTHLVSASHVTQAYIAHIADIDEYYDWSAVLAYHMAFHEKRRAEMAVARGQGKDETAFRKWAQSDEELTALYLSGRKKSQRKATNVPVKKKKPAVIPEIAPIPHMTVTPPISSILGNAKVPPNASSVGGDASSVAATGMDGAAGAREAGTLVVKKSKGKKKNQK